MSIASTILSQLGGNKFLAMTGAKNLMDHGDGLSLKFPKPQDRKVNYLKVSLGALDTYRVEFGYIRGLNYTEKESFSMVFADQLQSLFTDVTGLDTHL